MTFPPRAVRQFGNMATAYAVGRSVSRQYGNPAVRQYGNDFRTYAVGRDFLRQYGNSAIRPYGYDSSTWLHRWLGSDSVQLRNSYDLLPITRYSSPLRVTPSLSEFTNGKAWVWVQQSTERPSPSQASDGPCPPRRLPELPPLPSTPSDRLRSLTQGRPLDRPSIGTRGTSPLE